MPVMMLYKDKKIPVDVAIKVADLLATMTSEKLNAKVEVRVVEPIYSHNANELHIEMRFRDFGEWSDKQIADYHDAVMQAIGNTLKEQGVKCAYSFYIVPSKPPRSMWAQEKL